MSNEMNKIVIVGGGTAGWITAATLAAEHVNKGDASSITIELIESPNIPTIGVGEGTWPSMRETLKSIGIDESEFLSQCDASFKQGSKFVGWLDQTSRHYYHPFT
jgi:tryptophan 7-halogenase